MRKFSFNSEEIDAHISSQKEWYIFVRQREVEMAFSLFSKIKFPLALELGAGNGVQSETIAKHSKQLICTEIDEKSYSWLGQSLLDRKLANVEYRICDAQDLSQFGDKSFDLIYSSNMLEHIPDLHKCLAECRRVLKDGGIMLHTMPNLWWKTSTLVLSLGRIGVHGVSSNHLSEFHAFGYKTWISKFQKNGLWVSEVVGFPFYAGRGNSFIQIIKVGNLMKIPASYLYIVNKR
jgi:ubiquinone/menaquinone biosynthesis C-methylase UbiE